MRSQRQSRLFALVPMVWFCCFASVMVVAQEDDSGSLQEQGVQEYMRVLHYVMEVRVLDARSKPILGLKPEDFLLKNGREVIPVSTARWIDATKPGPGLPPTETGTVAATPNTRDKAPDMYQPNYERTNYGYVDTRIAPIEKPDRVKRETGDTQAVLDEADKNQASEPLGRFIVIYVQNDIASNRNQGLVHMIHHGKKILEGLAPQDYVAVFSFDSHLKMHLDFTRDRDAARGAIDRCLTKVPGRILFGGPPPSIADELNIDEAEDAAYTERAMELIARAVEHLPGEKILAYLGWGFGVLDETGVKTDARYDRMLTALYDAKVTVFSLDITMATYHSLEVAMQRVALETGGFYERTANHPAASIKRFLSSIEGYYLISFSVREDGPPPDFSLTIKGQRRAKVSFSRDYDVSAPYKRSL